MKLPLDYGTANKVLLPSITFTQNNNDSKSTERTERTNFQYENNYKKVLELLGADKFNNAQTYEIYVRLCQDPNFAGFEPEQQKQLVINEIARVNAQDTDATKNSAEEVSVIKNSSNEIVQTPTISNVKNTNSTKPDRSFYDIALNQDQLDTKKETLKTALALNFFIYEDKNIPKTTDDWNALFPKEQEYYLNLADIYVKENINDSYFNTCMTALEAANHFNMNYNDVVSGDGQLIIDYIQTVPENERPDYQKSQLGHAIDDTNALIRHLIASGKTEEAKKYQNTILSSNQLEEIYESLNINSAESTYQYYKTLEKQGNATVEQIEYIKIYENPDAKKILASTPQNKKNETPKTQKNENQQTTKSSSHKSMASWLNNNIRKSINDKKSLEQMSTEQQLNFLQDPTNLGSALINIAAFGQNGQTVFEKAKLVYNSDTKTIEAIENYTANNATEEQLNCGISEALSKSTSGLVQKTHVDRSYTVKDTNLQQKMQENTKNFSDTDTQIYAATNTYRLQKQNQNPALKMFTEGNKEANEAVIKNGTIARFDAENQVEASNILVNNINNRELFTEEEAEEQFAVMAGQVKNFATENQIAIHEMLWNTNYESVQEQLIENIKDYAPENQAAARDIVYEKSSEEQVDKVVEQIVDDKTPTQIQETEFPRVFGEAALKIQAIEAPDATLLEGNLSSEQLLTFNPQERRSYFETIFTKASIEEKIRLINKIPNGAQKRALFTMIAKFSKPLLKTMVDKGLGLEMLNSNLPLSANQIIIKEMLKSENKEVEKQLESLRKEGKFENYLPQDRKSPDVKQNKETAETNLYITPLYDNPQKANKPFLLIS